MKDITAQKKKAARIILLCILAVGIVYGLSALIVQLRLSTLTEHVTVRVAKQSEVLKDAAEAASRITSDGSTDVIIVDCTTKERTEFDALLSRLDQGLSSLELNKLERLFGRCGAFHAEQKAIMAASLARELEVFEMYLNDIETITAKETYETYRIEGWKTLAQNEKKQSVLFADLVRQQDEIITALLAGKRANSEEIKTILQSARETQEMLILTNRQAANAREELIPK